MDKIVKIFKAEVKSLDVEKKRAVVVISTDRKDRDGDIILPASFKKNLKSYKEHPILLSSHDYYRLMSQIGMAHKVTVGDKEVTADFEWFAGATGSDGKSLNPEADWGWFLAQKGIAAFSIGFQGNEFEWIEEKEQGGGGGMRITGRLFKEITLLEVSQVLVPSNAGALQNSIDDARLPVEAREMSAMVLKGIKDGKIIYQESVDAKQKKDNTDINQLDTRLAACEKMYADMKDAHDALETRIADLEAKQETPEVNEGEELQGGKGKHKHYSRDLLGAGGEDLKQSPDNEKSVEAEVNAIRDAFKS